MDHIKLLHIEDNEVDAVLLKEMLRTDGSATYTTVWCPTFEKALETLKNQQFDVIILDLTLPDIAQLEGLKQLLEHSNKNCIVILSSTDDCSLSRQAVQLGAEDFIVKKDLNQQLLSRSIAFAISRRQTKIALSQAVKTKDRFFSILAHDLRGPINSLVGVLEILETDFDQFNGKAMRSMLTKLHGNASNVSKLLNNLLDWSRLQAGNMPFKPEPILVADLFYRVINLFEETALQKKIDLEVTCPKNLKALADKNMLESVIRNLVSNALKFSHINGTVYIACQSADEASIALTVRDEGIGIPDKMMKQLFDLGSKNNRPGTAGELSAGLGLILVKDFVERNKGTVNVYSKVDHGTTFTITLPVAAGQMKRVRQLATQ
ncbi:response regulator [bacterium]|nr:response regulator [bacterium]